MVLDAAESKVDWLQFTPTDPTGTIPRSMLPNSQNFKFFEQAEREILETAKECNVKVVFRKPIHLNIRKTFKIF